MCPETPGMKRRKNQGMGFDMTGSRRLGLLTIAVSLVMAMIVPATAMATVQPFAATMPGGGGTGGGVGEVWPIGFGYINGQSGGVWGDGVGDTYQALTRDTTYISGTDPLGGPQRLVAFINKNPSIVKPYIKLKKNGVDVGALDSYIQTPGRNAAIVAPDYLSAYPILYSGSVQTAAWYVPITGIALEPGCAYELSFLRGLKGNNAMTSVIYTDTNGNELGYIQYNGTQTYPDENAQYIAKQYDVFRFRNAGAAVTDEAKRYEDFLFRFQTYASLTAYDAALADAQTVLSAASANAGYGPGQVDPADVDALYFAVSAATAVPTQTRLESLQTDVDSTVAGLQVATLAASQTNPLAPAATTSISGVPAGWSLIPVTFSLSASGVTGDASSHYSLDGGTDNTYVNPVVVSNDGTTTVSYYTTGALMDPETPQTATIRVDTTKPVTTLTGAPAGGSAHEPVTFSLSSADSVSGVAAGAVRYVLDSSPATSTYTSPVTVSELGVHTVMYWAKDVAGNKETAKTVTFTILPPRFDDTDSRIVYGGKWKTAAAATYSGGSMHYAELTPASATFYFKGTGFDLYSLASPRYGIATVSVDGAVTRVDMSSAAYVYQAKTFTVRGLEDATHTVTIAGTGELGSGTSKNVSIDAIDIVGTLLSESAVTAHYDDTDPLIAYTGKWKTVSSAFYAGGSMHYAEVTPAVATFYFKGTGVDVFSLKSPRYGIATITVDGVPTRVDMSSPGYTYQARTFSLRGLTDTVHTVTIASAGELGSGTSRNISIDEIDVFGSLVAGP